MKKIYRITPILEERIWGGQLLKERFHYDTDLENIAEAYHVIAIPGHLDNLVADTGEPLSVFFQKNRELFDCNCSFLPVRMVSACADGRLSYHLHPTDAYGLEHEGMRGKIEGGFTLTQSQEEYEMYLGHNARTREEFAAMVHEGRWEELMRRVRVKYGDFVHMPIGTLHGESGDGTEIMVAFSTNGDITYRLYDYGRVDPKRPLHEEKVIEVVNVPDNTIGSRTVLPRKEEGCLIYDYYSGEGEYVGKRVKTCGEGRFGLEEFMFILCVEGEGDIGGYSIEAGETLFVPAHFGTLQIRGRLDLCILSYIDGQSR